MLAGLALLVLPQIVIQEELKKGLLINVLSDEWDTEDDVLHAIYPDKQTILPAVKLFFGLSLASIFNMILGFTNPVQAA
ncbi:hypothetical protein INT80_09790 [Gallibacterium anatis]|uniref:Uncharacterized protein n=1 Tax=Gallibacterium anatis TaxID=750 RepID=A0A930UX06_9PAST|nr:hypothetical protein [Gallibacterium anatis]